MKHSYNQRNQYSFLIILGLILTVQLQAQFVFSPWVDTMQRDFSLLNEDSLVYITPHGIKDILIVAQNRIDSTIREVYRDYEIVEGEDYYDIREDYQNKFFRKKWKIRVFCDSRRGEIRRYYTYNTKGKLKSFDFSDSKGVSSYFQKYGMEGINVYARYKSDGTLKSFSQDYFIYKDEVRYDISEIYENRGFIKYWKVSIYSDPRDITWEYEYNMEGQLTHYVLRKGNQPLDSYKYFAYYPNGQLQGVFEWKFIEGKKKPVLWNILDYRHEDGTPYDYGVLKDGNGKVYHISDEGYWCQPTYYQNGKEVDAPD